MNRPNVITCLVMLLLAMAACAQPAPPVAQPLPTPNAAPASFVNKVWRVRESSSVAPGALYVFLSDGTMVMTSPNSTPALGKWKDEGGALTMIEEGRPYKTDVLRLTQDEFKIRSNNPGGVVEITLVPAEGSPRPR